MHSGYIQRMVDENQTYEEFIWANANRIYDCSHNKFERILQENYTYQYYLKEIPLLEKHIKGLCKSSRSRRITIGEKHKQNVIEIWRDHIREAKPIVVKARAMKAVVENCLLPPPYDELKKKILEDLTQAIDTNIMDWAREAIETVKRKDPLQIFQELLEEDRKKLRSYRENLEKQEEKSRIQYEWIKGLEILIGKQ